MFSGRRIRCVLVHDHILLRQGLRRLLEDEPEIEVVAESESAEDALKHVLEHRPEIVITDAAIFGFSPEQVGLLLRQLSPPTRVLFLSMEEASKPGDARTDAACAVRNTSAQELSDKIRQMRPLRGTIKELPRKNRIDWPDSTPSSPTPALTAREQEILKLLAEGRTVRLAAQTLGLSTKTVDAHKFNLMRKLGIHNKAELVMWAIRKRLLKIPSNF